MAIFNSFLYVYQRVAHLKRGAPRAMTTTAWQVLIAVAASNASNGTADSVLHGVDEIVNETLEPAVEREDWLQNGDSWMTDGD